MCFITMLRLSLPKINHNKKKPLAAHRRLSPNTITTHLKGRTTRNDFNRISSTRQIGRRTMIGTAVTPQVTKGILATLNRHHLKYQQILTVYHKAIAAIREKKQWSNGESLDLYTGIMRGRKARVWIKNEGGRLFLTLFCEGTTGQLDKRFYSKPLLIGLFKPDEGWCVCTDETQYRAWNLSTRRAMEASKVYERNRNYSGCVL